MAVEVKMPKFGETMTEGTIFKWLKNEGDSVQEGEPLFEIETDKATLEVEAESEGILKKIHVNENEKAPIGERVAIIADEDEMVEDLITRDKEESTTEKQKTAKERTSGRKTGIKENVKIKATPAARRLAREKEIDLSQVKSQGDREAIIENDVLEHIEKQRGITVEREKVKMEEIETEKKLFEDEETKDKIKEIPLSGMRKVIARRMTSSYQEIPHVTLNIRVDMKEVEELKNGIGRKIDEHITYTDIFIMAAARVLKDYPRFNSHLVLDTIKIYPDINIGLAVDIEEGLVVTVIKKVDKLGLAEIAKSREHLVDKAKKEELKTTDTTEGTFTITNMGNLGVEFFNPIINPPQVAILGIGKITEQPLAVKGQVKIRPAVWLSLSFDHRAVDGAPAGEFLTRIKELLEEPYLLLS